LLRKDKALGVGGIGGPTQPKAHGWRSGFNSEKAC
jgi:hypothetical protein